MEPWQYFMMVANIYLAAFMVMKELWIAAIALCILNSGIGYYIGYRIFFKESIITHKLPQRTRGKKQ